MKILIILFSLFVFVGCNSQSDIPKDYRPGLPPEPPPPPLPVVKFKDPMLVSAGTVWAKGSQVQVRARINATNKKLEGAEVKATVLVK